MTVLSVYVETLTMIVNRVQVGETQKSVKFVTLYRFPLAKMIKMSNLV